MWPDMIIAVLWPGPVLGRWGVPPVPVVTTLAWSNYAHTRIAILIVYSTQPNTLSNSWCQRNVVEIITIFSTITFSH